MNLHALLNFLVAILTITTGLFATLKNRKSKINFSFFLLTLSAFIWQIGTGFAILSKSPYLALIGTKIAFFGIILIPVLSYHLTLYLTATTKYRILIIGYIFAFLLFIPLSWTSLILNGVYKYPWGFFFKAGPLHPIFLSFFAFFMVLVFSNLFLSYKRETNSLEKNRKKYFLIALFMAYIGSVDYLPAYGIQIYPFGYLMLICFISIFAYAILRYQLMGIEVIIKKTLAYSILISIITMLYFIIVYLLERAFSIIVGYRSVPLAIMIIALFSIIFTPLKNKIQHSIDKYFFKGTIVQIERERELLSVELERSERLKTVSSLAAGMAHEIKNPLTSIKTFVEYMDKKYQDPEFKRRFNSIVPKEIDKISNIINQLLDYSKTDRVSLKSCNIHDILDYVLDLYSNEFIRKNIKAEKLYNSQFPNITCDENQMKQAFINIVLNSIEAMPEGGNLTVATKDAANGLEVSIRDTGPGIPKEKLKNVFDPFYTTKQKGTGLGLFIVHQILENNKGRIIINSEVNKGTVVKVKFQEGKL